MRYVIIGCGNVGMELARRWVSAGHQVIGTTTSPDRVPSWPPSAPRWRSSVAATVPPSSGPTRGRRRGRAHREPAIARAFDADQRIAEYADTLTASARTAAAVHPRVVSTSSVSVYGAGHGALVDEATPVTDDPDASPRNSRRRGRRAAAPRGARCGSPTCTGIRATSTIRPG